MMDDIETKPQVRHPVDAQKLAQRLDGGATALLFTTNQGLEDVVVEEFGERTAAAGLEVIGAEKAPFGLNGYVLVESPDSFEKLEPIALQMRSIHHVLHPLYSFALPPQGALDTIRREVGAREVPQMDSARTFRVTSKRSGSSSGGSRVDGGEAATRVSGMGRSHEKEL